MCAQCAEAPHGLLEARDLLLLGDVLPAAGARARAGGRRRRRCRCPARSRIAPAVELGDLATPWRRAGGGRGRSSPRRRRSRPAARSSRSRRRHVQVRLGLVEQQHVGAPGEAGGERDELALPAGELARGQLERVVDAERAQVAERLALERGRRRRRSSAASSRSWWASARVIASRSAASAGSASRCSAACSSASSVAELGPRGAHGRERVALVAVDDLRQVGEHEPAAARDRAGVGVVEAGEDAHQRRLPAAVGAEDAELPRARLDVEIPCPRGSSGRRRTSRSLRAANCGTNDIPLASRLAARRAIEPAAPPRTPHGSTSNPHRARRPPSTSSKRSRQAAGSWSTRAGRGRGVGRRQPDDCPSCRPREVGAAAIRGDRAVGRASARHAGRHLHDGRPRLPAQVAEHALGLLIAGMRDFNQYARAWSWDPQDTARSPARRSP